eukprot:gene14015-14133_t
MTRSSGFSVHPDTSGGEFKRHTVSTYKLDAGERVSVTFNISGHKPGDLLGYGLWFWCSSPTTSISLSGGPQKRTLTEYGEKSWNKAGSIWNAIDDNPITVTVTFDARKGSEIALYDPVCGRIQHKHLDNARQALLLNMFEIAPEAVFVDGTIDASVEIVAPESVATGTHPLLLKSCNRCGSIVVLADMPALDDCAMSMSLKFEVNAAHNPQRSSAQMKEDGARRRAFELLLAELYEGTPQLRYRHEHNSELADDVWNRFHHKCFNCGAALKSAREMNLDHTRPLAFLWPLDGTATALCKSCNSLKRDRSPHEFYTADSLARLSRITGIPLDELQHDRPNEEAIGFLLRRLNWFFDDFLSRDEMTKERDGKITGELVPTSSQN